MSEPVTTDLIKELMGALDAMLDGWQMRTDGSEWIITRMPSGEAGKNAWLAIGNANAYLEKVGANADFLKTLKPCPFCGSNAEYIHLPVLLLRCSKCWIAINPQWYGGDLGTTEASWNTRAGDVA